MTTRTNTITLSSETWERLDEVAKKLGIGNRQDTIAYLIMKSEVH